MEYLFILPSGRNVDNPSELLDAMAMNRLLDEARGSFDMTILDMAPILPVADASIVAPKVDGVILSYQIGRIGRDLLKRSKSRLESLGANIWGIILNDIQAEIDYWGSEYSQYHYRYNGERQRKKSGWAAWGMKWFKRNPHKKVR
jgi:Mrp family chromosome partitioning ATPase